ncbi:hypothetical protein IQ219_01435 [Synechocystis sp. LEGE 06083]|nr:hypothetical protein [Synechocystis sp. LEGE 06083]
MEPDRPDRLMKLASIDDDGEWCRLHKPDCHRPGFIGELGYLPELLPAPPGLIAEFFPNGTGLDEEYSSSELVSKYI